MRLLEFTKFTFLGEYLSQVAEVLEDRYSHSYLSMRFRGVKWFIHGHMLGSADTKSRA